MDARVARVPYVVVPPHNVKRQISCVKRSDCTHGRCGRRSVTTIEEVEPDSHSQHQCEQLEQPVQLKTQDNNVSEFRNAVRSILMSCGLHLPELKPTDTYRGRSRERSRTHHGLDLRNNSITSSRRADQSSRM